MTRVMRCRVGLEPDEPAPPDREGHNPDPCKIREGWEGEREGERGRTQMGVEEVVTLQFKRCQYYNIQ